MTDRQTDKQTDGRPGKNNMSPNPSGGGGGGGGGGHNYSMFKQGQTVYMSAQPE